VKHAAYSPAKLMGLGLSAMLIPLGSTMIAVALPSIGAEFSRKPDELTSWLVNSYLLVNIIALGPGGKAGDHWGFRNTLRTGQGLFGLGALLPVFFHAFAALVAGRMLMALGGALMVPTVMAIIKISVPPQRRHRVFGYMGAMMGFSAALGPTLGGQLLHHFGWLAIFLTNIPPLAVSFVLSLRFFREDLHEKPPGPLKFDLAGSALLAGFLLCLVLGLKTRDEFLLAPALVLLAVFIWRQKTAAHPLIDLGLFSGRHFSAGCAMVALQNFGMYALLFQLPYLLKALYGWGPEQSGHAMTAFMVSMMTCSMLGGRVAEKAGVRLTCVTGSLLCAAGFYWLSFLGPAQDSLHLVGALVLGGGGLGLGNGPSQSAALGAVPHRQSGVASGLLTTSRYLGGVIGISILGLLLSDPSAAQSLDKYREAILIFTGAFMLAALVSLLLPGWRQDPVDAPPA
jgi:EmrB/QacA subfamily drug resistance transporter